MLIFLKVNKFIFLGNFMNFDFKAETPGDELHCAFQRVPRTEYAHFGSLEGRRVCVLNAAHHLAAIVLKPLSYLFYGCFSLAMGLLLEIGALGSYRLRTLSAGRDWILTGCVAPLGQIFQLFKSTMGILHPGFYFKEDELEGYFAKLADIAEQSGAEPQFIDLLRDGATIIYKRQAGPSLTYYQTLFKEDFSFITEKLSGSDLSSEEKMAILKMLDPRQDEESGLRACWPGLGRILEYMCQSLNVPNDPIKIIPWLVERVQEESLNTLAMQEDVQGTLLQLMDVIPTLKLDPTHVVNVLIAKFGTHLHLSQNLIERASHDSWLHTFAFTNEEEEALLNSFNDIYTEEKLMDYLLDQINSQPDGKPGLKILRDHMIQTLCNQISDQELEDAKEDVQQHLGISDLLADDPAMYVKSRYFLYPSVDPSDERATDLNEEGIRRFAETLENNPFNYFKEDI